MGSWHALCSKKNKEGATMRYLLAMSSAILGVGLVLWTFSGNPEPAPRVYSAQPLDSDPNLKLVTERSPYMRSER